MTQTSPIESRCTWFRGASRHHTAIVLLTFVVLTAGCSGFIGGDSVDDSAPLDDIPAEADGVVHFQTAVLTDSVTESVMDDLAEMEETDEVDNIDDPESWDEAISEFESEVGFDIDEFHSMTVFVGDATLEDEEEYAGIIIQSDLDWEDFESAADEEVETADVQEDSYNDVTVYVESDEFSEFDTWIADFDDGTFAIGPEPVVRDVIDTHQGDAPGIDDDLRNTYEDATEGYITAALTLTEDQADMAGDIASEEAGIGEMLVPEAKAVTMSYHTDGDQLNAEMDIVMQSEEEAETFTGFVQPFLDPPSLEENPDPEAEPFEWLVGTVSIDSTDDRVSMEFSADPDELATALESLEELDDPGMFGEDFS